MKFTIKQKSRKDVFISLFKVLKNCSSLVNMMFKEDHLYIQGMDKAHVCLFDLKIMSSWFESYEIKKEEVSVICLDSQIFQQILSFAQEKDTILFEYEDEPDNIKIHLLNNENVKGEFNKTFKLPLTDMECDLLSIPEVEYDAEFTMNAIKINEIISQLSVFGEILNVECSEEEITLSSDGVVGNMKASIPIDDLNDFSITEGQQIGISYSLNYIQKMCLTTKLSQEIQFSICKDYPMKINYDLGEKSSFVFYIAPKMDD